MAGRLSRRRNSGIRDPDRNRLRFLSLRLKTEPEQDEPSAFPNDDSQAQTNYSLFDNVTEDVQNQPFTIEKPKIKKIIFVYDDDTFEEIIRR